MTRDEIRAEYKRLGYSQGWTFMMTKEARLTDAKVCLVGLNPGGEDTSGCERWSCECGNTYHTEEWDESGGLRCFSKLQRRVQLLEKVLDLGPDDYLAAQFIPFRSRDWKSLPRKPEAIKFGQKLWTWVFAESPAKLFLCLGSVVAAHMVKLAKADRTGSFDMGWRSTAIERYEGVEGRTVIYLPHLSRYAIGEEAATLNLARWMKGQPEI